MAPTEQMDGLQADLASLESIWEDGMRDAYAFYRSRCGPQVALAAALTESAADLQALGRRAPEPPQLLLGDLCLARASRVLARTRNQRLQIGFASAVERVAAGAAHGQSVDELRALLLRAIADAE